MPERDLTAPGQVWVKPKSWSDGEGYQREPGWPVILCKSRSANPAMRGEDFLIFCPPGAGQMGSASTEVLPTRFMLTSMSGTSAMCLRGERKQQTQA
eukprot:40409-Hanusia_phi.AAC.2